MYDIVYIIFYMEWKCFFSNSIHEENSKEINI